MIALGWIDLALASLLLVLNGALSFAFSLGLERKLAIAAIRMIIQLMLVGLVLTWLFASGSPLWTALAAFVMLAVAGYEVMSRQTRQFAGLWSYGIGAATMTLVAIMVTVLALTTQINPTPWWSPQYAIPILGMILGNTMTGVSLGLEGFTTAAVRDRSAIEARLALGETRWVAIRIAMLPALRSGFIPIINAMAAAGIVSLPGMMTGQILAGAPPTEAVKYQLLIMFLIAGATGLGVVMAVGLGARRLTDERHRLRLDRLRSTSG